MGYGYPNTQPKKNIEKEEKSDQVSTYIAFLTSRTFASLFEPQNPLNIELVMIFQGKREIMGPTYPTNLVFQGALGAIPKRGSVSHQPALADRLMEKGLAARWLILVFRQKLVYFDFPIARGF